jgi:hypothetical protein
MTMRTRLASFLLLTCAALACSGGKSDEVTPDGSVRSDLSAAETNPSNPDSVRSDGQATEALPSDGLVSDGSAQDAPAPVTDGQALSDALDAMAEGGVVEAGAPGLDAASDGKDSGAIVLLDARPNDTPPAATDAAQADAVDGPLVTDAGVNDPEVPLAGSPDAAPDGPGQCGRIMCDCTYNGKKLWGKVQYVDSFPDFKVKVSYFPDLNVQETSFPTSCGQWQVVTSFPDFKVQKVDYFEDFDIAYSYFPGIP